MQRQGYFGSGRSVIRVYDTRDFEFEISIDNLIGILMYSDISKRDIQEECVFAWDGKDLILLPVNSEEYQQSITYTKKQSLSVSAKTLVKGHTYTQKKSNTKLVYMGYYDYYDYVKYSLNHTHLGKKHIFYDVDKKTFAIPTVSTLASVIDDSIYASFADIDQKLHNSIHFTELKSLTLVDTYEKIKLDEKYCHWYKQENDGIVSLYLPDHVQHRDLILPTYLGQISKKYIEKIDKNIKVTHTVFTSKEHKYINELFKALQLDWVIDSDKLWCGNSIKGTPIPVTEFKEKLIQAGYIPSCKLIAVTIDDKEILINNR